jgi:hypothetical protein
MKRGQRQSGCEASTLRNTTSVLRGVTAIGNSKVEIDLNFVTKRRGQKTQSVSLMKWRQFTELPLTFSIDTMPP